jgi:hypothetical protein
LETDLFGLDHALLNSINLEKDKIEDEGEGGKGTLFPQRTMGKLPR